MKEKEVSDFSLPAETQILFATFLNLQLFESRRFYTGECAKRFDKSDEVETFHENHPEREKKIEKSKTFHKERIISNIVAQHQTTQIDRDQTSRSATTSAEKSKRKLLVSFSIFLSRFWIEPAMN